MSASANATQLLGFLGLSGRTRGLRLGRRLCRGGFGVGLYENELDKPLAGNATPIHLRWSENPLASRLHSEVREVFAGAWSSALGIRDIPGGVDVDADARTNAALNCCAGFVGNVRHDLVKDFAA